MILISIWLVGLLGVNTTFNNMSVILVVLTGVPGENHRPVASHITNFITYCCIEKTSPERDFETHNVSGDRH